MDNYNWSDSVDCAITVCNAAGVIIYMNNKAQATFAKHGNLIGKNLLDCHNENSIRIIKKLLATGGTHTYTIEKKGVKKLIHQSAWKDAEGNVAGLVEFSIVIPNDAPNFIR